MHFCHEEFFSLVSAIPYAQYFVVWAKEKIHSIRKCSHNSTNKVSLNVVKVIHIASDFSYNPGGWDDGKVFRLNFLEPAMKKDQVVVIDFLNTNGFSTAFLKGSFGVLSEKYGAKEVLKKFILETGNDFLLKEEIVLIVEGKL